MKFTECVVVGDFVQYPLSLSLIVRKLSYWGERLGEERGQLEKDDVETQELLLAGGATEEAVRLTPSSKDSRSF